jgi:adenine-specific DNA methylase
MRKMKQGLKGLFTNEINPLLVKFKSKKREWEEWEQWEAFEGAFEEAMHRLREHVITAIWRYPQRLYGEK